MGSIVRIITTDTTIAIRLNMLCGRSVTALVCAAANLIASAPMACPLTLGDCNPDGRCSPICGIFKVACHKENNKLGEPQFDHDVCGDCCSSNTSLATRPTLDRAVDQSKLSRATALSASPKTADHSDPASGGSAESQSHQRPSGSPSSPAKCLLCSLGHSPFFDRPSVIPHIAMCMGQVAGESGIFIRPVPPSELIRPPIC